MIWMELKSFLIFTFIHYCHGINGTITGLCWVQVHRLFGRNAR